MLIKYRKSIPTRILYSVTYITRQAERASPLVGWLLVSRGISASCVQLPSAGVISLIYSKKSRVRAPMIASTNCCVHIDACILSSKYFLIHLLSMFPNSQA